MRNLALTIAYDGTNYVGWQIQPNGPSIQSEVEQAILKLTGEQISVLTAGRTDSGVHALGQVASFRTSSKIPIEKFIPGLHNFLPDDIAIRNAREVPDNFHATYSAKKKWYRYIIHNSRIRHPFLDRYTWRVSQHLDAEAMQDAAQHLLGTHDFRCFESHFPNKATSVRTIMSASIARRPECPMWNTCSKGDEFPDVSTAKQTLSGKTSPGDFIWFDVVADGFLYNMVRAIVGTLIKVGLNRWSPNDIPQIIQSQDRSQAGETAPPQGLYLMRVDYGDLLPTNPAESST
ncbi:MAG: tRNA pseudouridine(38-40) synthase TruA [Planctomycetaceae bacterium]